MNSTGTVFPRMFRPINALYAKVIICSLTVSHTTSIIDGLNRPVNRSDGLPEPKGHAWATQQPLPSRGLPYEDSLSALYGTPAGLVIQRPGVHDVVANETHLTMLETATTDYSGGFSNSTEASVQRLDWLEANFVHITSMSYACLGEYYGYKNLRACVEFIRSLYRRAPLIVLICQPQFL